MVVRVRVVVRVRKKGRRWDLRMYGGQGGCWRDGAGCGGEKGESAAGGCGVVALSHHAEMRKRTGFLFCFVLF